MKDLLKKILKKDTTEVYRGTVSAELLQEYKEAQQRKKDAQEAWMKAKNECWEKAYAELGLNPEGDYELNIHTGQIIEEVSIDELKQQAGA